MFADVTSANIVGYMGKSMAGAGVPARKHMVTPTFAQIGQKGCHLSEVTANGYQDSFLIQLGAEAPMIELVKMSYGGMAEKTYVWVDEYVGEPGEGAWTGGYWKNKVSGKKIGTDDETDPLLRSGESYWMAAPATTDYEDIESINLLFNGEVLQKSEAYPLAAAGVPARKHGIGNMMPVNVGLTGITAAGYEDSFLIQLGAEAPTIEAVKLSYGGMAEKTYVWVDEYVGEPGEGTWTGGYWKNKVTGDVLVPTGTTPGAGEEAELVLKPGDGLWVAAPATVDYEDIELITLTFPKTF